MFAGGVSAISVRPRKKKPGGRRQRAAAVSVGDSAESSTQGLTPSCAASQRSSESCGATRSSPSRDCGDGSERRSRSGEPAREHLRCRSAPARRRRTPHTPAGAAAGSRSPPRSPQRAAAAARQQSASPRTRRSRLARRARVRSPVGAAVEAARAAEAAAAKRRAERAPLRAGVTCRICKLPPFEAEDWQVHAESVFHRTRRLGIEVGVDSDGDQLTPNIEPEGWSQASWRPDHLAPACHRCDARFTLTRRRHHCRYCGEVFCRDCCSQTIRLPRGSALNWQSSQRVCDACEVVLKAKCVEWWPDDSKPAP